MQVITENVGFRYYVARESDGSKLIVNWSSTEVVVLPANPKVLKACSCVCYAGKGESEIRNLLDLFSQGIYYGKPQNPQLNVLLTLAGSKHEWQTKVERYIYLPVSVSRLPACLHTYFAAHLHALRGWIRRNEEKSLPSGFAGGMKEMQEQCQQAMDNIFVKKLEYHSYTIRRMSRINGGLQRFHKMNMWPLQVSKTCAYALGFNSKQNPVYFKLNSIISPSLILPGINYLMASWLSMSSSRLCNSTKSRQFNSFLLSSM